MKRCDVPRDAPKDYRRHEPENTVLHQIVREHLNTFLELADARSGEGRGLPRYVKNAFRSFLECGILAYGFARLRCPDCGYDTVVAFSCKERGLCPSCAARHMSETAAFLSNRGPLAKPPSPPRTAGGLPPRSPSTPRIRRIIKPFVGLFGALGGPRRFSAVNSTTGPLFFACFASLREIP